MGFLAFAIFCVVVCAIAWGATWVLNRLLPVHPAWVETLIWGVAGLIIVMKLLQVTGLIGHDPMIPHV